MRRILLVSSLLAGLVAFGSKPADASISLDIHVGDPAPVAIYQQPRGYFVPDYNVWYYQNSAYDMYRFGNVWYLNDGGYWYSARSWRGPFVGVRYASVPTQIVRIPSRYHRQTRGYWQAQPQTSWNQRNQWDQRNQPRYRTDNNNRRDDGQWSRNDDNDQGHGKKNHGRGNGRGHGNGNGNGND